MTATAITARSAYRVLLRVAAISIVAALATLLLVDSVKANTWDHAPTSEWSTAPSATEALIAGHDCWTGQGPVGVIPGHVVYGGRYLGPKATGKALAAVLGRPSTLSAARVAAFCR